MSRIDYIALNKQLEVAKASGNEGTFLDECIRLSKAHPRWDWSRQPPNTAPQDVLNAYQQIADFLQKQPDFTPYFHGTPVKQFMERWRDRGAEIPVTSDHVMITNTFTLLAPQDEPKVLSLRVSTWNLMNKAHSKDNCAKKDPKTGKGLYANTPEEDLDETDDAYRERKNEQIAQIIQHIRSIPTPDSIFLQEIDFLTLDKFRDLKAEFESKLKDLGFGILISPTPPPACKPQAILYNTEVLTLDETIPPRTVMPGTEVDGKDPRNTLFEANFTYKDSSQKICLISAHLDFEGDYSCALRDYSERKAASGAMVVWGGDTNHAPGHKIQGLTGDFDHATNYDVDRAGKHTVQHGGSSKAKAYDGFGFCPPPSGYRMQSTEEQGFRFSYDANDKISIVPFTPKHPHHLSLLGYPWMRRQGIVLDVLGYRDAICGVLSKIIGKKSSDPVMSVIASQDEVEKIEKDVQKLAKDPNYAQSDFSEANALIEQAKRLLGNDRALQACIDRRVDVIQARKILTGYFEPDLKFNRDGNGNVTGVSPVVKKSSGFFSFKRNPSAESAAWIAHFDKIARGLDSKEPSSLPGKTLSKVMSEFKYNLNVPHAPAQKI